MHREGLYGQLPPQPQEPYSSPEDVSRIRTAAEVGHAITANNLAIEEAEDAIGRLGPITELEKLKNKHEAKVGDHWEELRKLANMNGPERRNVRRRAITSRDAANRTRVHVGAMLDELTE